MENMKGNASLNGELDVVAFMRIIWRRRWWIFLTTILVTIGGVAYALMAEEMFRAEVVVVPTVGGDSKSGARGGLMSAFGGLASMAGISLGGGGSVEENLAVLTSRTFVSEFIKSNNLKAQLTKNELSDWKLHRIFVRMLDVQDNPRSNLIRVGLTWRDPVRAASWVNKLIVALNDHLRREAIERSNENLKYLQTELQRTRIEEMRLALYELISQEQKKAMVANTQQEFAFRVLDKAVAPEERNSPKRKKIVLIAMITGLFLALLIVFVREAVDRLKHESDSIDQNINPRG